MINKLIYVLMFSSISIFPFTVYAEVPSSKTYVEAGMMFLTIDALNEIKGPDFQGVGITVEDSASVTNVKLGYNVNTNLALEGAIILGGKVSASIANGSFGTINGNAYTFNAPGTVSAKTDNTYLLGVKLALATRSPLNFSIKAGQMFWDIDYIAALNGSLTLVLI
jgi:hypothetical protein